MTNWYKKTVNYMGIAFCAIAVFMFLFYRIMPSGFELDPTISLIVIFVLFITSLSLFPLGNRIRKKLSKYGLIAKILAWLIFLVYLVVLLFITIMLFVSILRPETIGPVEAESNSYTVRYETYTDFYGEKYNHYFIWKDFFLGVQRKTSLPIVYLPGDKITVIDSLGAYFIEYVKENSQRPSELIGAMCDYGSIDDDLFNKHYRQIVSIAQDKAGRKGEYDVYFKRTRSKSYWGSYNMSIKYLTGIRASCEIWNWDYFNEPGYQFSQTVLVDDERVKQLCEEITSQYSKIESYQPVGEEWYVFLNINGKTIIEQDGIKDDQELPAKIRELLSTILCRDDVRLIPDD